MSIKLCNTVHQITIHWTRPTAICLHIIRKEPLCLIMTEDIMYERLITSSTVIGYWVPVGVICWEGCVLCTSQVSRCERCGVNYCIICWNHRGWKIDVHFFSFPDVTEDKVSVVFCHLSLSHIILLNSSRNVSCHRTGCASTGAVYFVVKFLVN